MGRSDQTADDTPGTGSTPDPTPGDTDRPDTGRPGADRAATVRGVGLIVGVGASAGGVAAIDRVLAASTATLGFPIIFIQHTDPTGESVLVEILRARTNHPVGILEDGMVPEPDHIYLPPPNKLVGILGGTISLVTPARRGELGHAVDFFFKLLADDRRAAAVGVLLSGTGGDGTQGLKAIRENCGFTIAQDPATAEYSGMPASAIDANFVDSILPPEGIINAIIDFDARRHKKVITNGDTDHRRTAEINRVLVLLKARTGHDMSFYKKNTIARRIERRLRVNRLDTIAEYSAYAQSHPEELETLCSELLIGVTSFFRDKAAFDALDQQVLAGLFTGDGPTRELRIWVAGCSTGEEAYSVAMLCAKHAGEIATDVRVQIFATDIDRSAIETARQGIYRSHAIADVPNAFVTRFFDRANGTYKVRKIIREMIVFSEQNLVRDPPFSRINLVVCRNVLIYFDPSLQKRVIPLFHYALKANGYLFLGTSETVGEFDELFCTVDRPNKIFQRRPGTSIVESWISILPTGGHPIGPALTAQLKPDEASVRDLLVEKLLDDYCPTAVIVDAAGEILQIHGRTGRYFELPAGRPSHNIASVARQGLQLQLVAALREVERTRTRIAINYLAVQTNGGVEPVDVIVEPIRGHATTDGPTTQGLVFIAFFDHTPDPGADRAGDPGATRGDAADHQVRDLERQLVATKEHLQSTIEELETSNEELKSINEELQSTNEELQSANEEHETSKEELQSVNEELVTLNSELQSKVAQLAKANNDMENLLASTQIGTIFLDMALSIRRFTPSVTAIIHLIDGDIGRPLRHINTEIDYPDLVDDIERVVHTLVPHEQEARATDGRWYAVRISPYRTTENLIEGVVVTFFDVTDRKVLEVDRRLQAVVRDSYDAVLVIGFDRRLLAWNRGAERMYGYPERDALSGTLDLITPGGQRDGFTDLVARLRRGETVAPSTTTRRNSNGELLTVLVTATLLTDERGRPMAVASTERDVTDQQRLAEQEARLRAAIEAVPDLIVTVTLGCVILDANAAAHRTIGAAAGALTGRSLGDLLAPGSRTALQQSVLQCHSDGRAPISALGLAARDTGTPTEIDGALTLITDDWHRPQGLVLVARPTH